MVIIITNGGVCGGGGCKRDKSTAFIILFQSRVLTGRQDSAIGQLISR